MKTYIIEVSDDDDALIRKLLEDLAPADGEPHSPPFCNSHGVLSTPEKLLGMLAEDCALAHRRPGSWEGYNMLTVLSSHGYGPHG